MPRPFALYGVDAMRHLGLMTIAIMMIMMVCPPGAFAVGSGEGVLYSNNVYAVRSNDYANNRFIVTYQGVPGNAAYLEIEHANKTYRLSAQSSGTLTFTRNGTYYIRWFDGSGNKVAWITPLTTQSIANETPLDFTEYQGGDVQILSSTSYYAAYRDEYRLDYDIPTQYIDHYVLEYTGRDDNGSIYTRTYNHAPSGIHYLTCNGGDYVLYFYKSSQLVAKTSSHYVDGIINPTCASYADSGRIDDLGAVYTPGSGLTWNPVAGADHYDIWKDGQLIGSIPGTNYPTAPPGSYTIIAKDSYGNKIGQSDINTNQPNQPNDPGCDICEVIGQLPHCPGWSQYIGSWTNALSQIIPTPKQIMDEFMSRLPTISDTIANDIADELESREKPVQPPPSIPQPFTPSTPIIDDYDMADIIDDSLTDDVPDFTPDFSDSKPFIIPDPFDYEFDNEDIGYMHIQPVLDTRDYVADTSPDIEPDRGYNPPGAIHDPDDIPTYNMPGDIDLGDMPAYNTPISDPGTIPDYTIPGVDDVDYTMPNLGDNPGYNPVLPDFESLILGGGE